MQLTPTGAGSGRLPALTLLALATAAAPASGLELDGQEASYGFRNFTDADHVHVQSHVLEYDVELRGGASLDFHWNHETVTVPGVDAQAGTQEAVDAITTASRPIQGGGDAFRDFSKVRNEFQGSVAFPRAEAGYYLSTESDYFAQQVRGSYNRDFFDQNLNVLVGSSFGWDAIEPLEDEDTAAGDDRRVTWNWNAVAAQVLSPTVVLRVGGEIYVVKGLQHSPYRNVYAGGGPQPERHPDQRIRRDAFVKLSKYLKNRSSLKLEYVAYQDDWGVSSHALGGQLNQYVSSDVLVRYRYRYYTQSAADFYRPEYEDSTGVGGYRTGDYRLRDFDSHLFGVRVEINLGGLADRAMLRRVNLELKYERYFNTNNFSANIFESGLSYRF
jgi:hypothetical protein